MNFRQPTIVVLYCLAATLTPLAGGSSDLPNLEGNWTGTWQCDPSHAVQMRVSKQKDNKVKGEVTYALQHKNMKSSMKGTMELASDGRLSLSIKVKKKSSTDTFILSEFGRLEDGSVGEMAGFGEGRGKGGVKLEGAVTLIRAP